MKPKQPSEFLHQSALGIAVVCLAIMPLLTINNFLQGRYVLALSSIVVLAMFAFHAWTITRHGRYYDALILFGLLPMILFILWIALRDHGIIGVLWCYPSVAALYMTLPERKAWLANSVLLSITLPLAWHVLPPSIVLRMAVTLILVSIFLAIFVRVINQQQYRLQAQITVDPLTGLLNRTLLQDVLEQATEQSNRTQISMTLAALDIDHFKGINDTFGHEAGDDVLCAISQLLLGRIRRVDKVFRLGGEEFLVLFYGTNAQNSYRLAQELRTAIAALPCCPDRSVTVSMGLATLRPKETWFEWMKRSDKNLYRAKSMGRDRVIA